MVSGRGWVTPSPIQQWGQSKLPRLLLNRMHAPDGQPPWTYAHAVIPPEILRSLPLADEILESHRHPARPRRRRRLRRLQSARVSSCELRSSLAPDRPDRDDKLAIAAAFHDLAAFDTLDSLVPSIAAQDEWLQETGRRIGRRAGADDCATSSAFPIRPDPGPRTISGGLSAGRPRRRQPGPDPIRYPEFLRRGSTRRVRCQLFFKRVVPSGALRALRKFQLPGFLLPRNALVRSGHEGIDR